MRFLWFLRDLDLLGVVLHAVCLAVEAVALGGVVYAFMLGRRGRWLPAHRRLACFSAVGVAVSQLAALVLSITILEGQSSFSVGSLLGTAVARDTLFEAAGGICLALIMARRPQWPSRLILAPAVVVLAGAVAQTHAASSLTHRVFLLALTLLHHLSVAAWAGMLPYLLLTLRAGAQGSGPWAVVQRFSRVALLCVAVLVATGIGLSCVYVGSWRGLYGTTYGIMILAKCWLLLMMLLLAACNHRTVRTHGQSGGLLQLRRFGEAEIGLGLTAILAAASLTAQPPAADMTQDQLSLQQIAHRMRWESPRLSSPPLRQLAPPTPLDVSIQDSAYGAGSASDANDRAWSEYNHHWAGLVLLACAALALLAHALPRGVLRQAAAQWPLLFAALGVFILLRADPENWPLGPRPFWASFSAPDVLEHRLFAALVMAFAFFEWVVETERWRSRIASYIFPLLLAFGGAALLTHTHAMGSVQDETLAGLSHTLIAVLGATAGWVRWLQLRLPGTRAARYAAWVWPVCLALVGMVLLDYRES